MACWFGHKWNGCKCTKCGKIRAEGHTLIEDQSGRYVCSTCGTLFCRWNTHITPEYTNNIIIALEKANNKKGRTLASRLRYFASIHGDSANSASLADIVAISELQFFLGYMKLHLDVELMTQAAMNNNRFSEKPEDRATIMNLSSTISTLRSTMQKLGVKPVEK